MKECKTAGQPGHRVNDIDAKRKVDNLPIKRGAVSEKWRELALPLRKKYGNRVVDEALNRLEHGDVWEWEGSLGVRVRADLGDQRLRAKSYWPTGDGQSVRFLCKCQEARTRGVCGHALAALIYEQSRDDIGTAA